MTSDDMVLGKRYKLVHGTGTLVGFETFDMYGNQDEMSLTPTTYDPRGVFKLDEGHTWPFDGLYYSWLRDIEEVNNG